MLRWRAVLPIGSIALASVGLWHALAPAPARPVPAATPTSVPATTEVSPKTPTTAGLPTTTGLPKAPPAATSTAPTTTAPTTTTTPRLLDPEPVPADARADVAVLPVGRIAIPKIGLDTTMYEGVWLTVIDVGPGHWPGTPLPGGFGNVVVAGHRVTHTHPFRDLDLLVTGDEIVFTLPDGSKATYRVTEQFIVEPDALWITDQEPGSIVTLFACHPKGSARQRIVVRGELIPPAR